MSIQMKKKTSQENKNDEEETSQEDKNDEEETSQQDKNEIKEKNQEDVNYEDEVSGIMDEEEDREAFDEHLAAEETSKESDRNLPPSSCGRRRKAPVRLNL